jgi:hypothetical protein
MVDDSWHAGHVHLHRDVGPLIGERGFATGIARISLDGVFIAAVDTRTPFQEEYQATPLARPAWHREVIR